ncbi:hypothetical protein [Thermomonas sp.]|uniref:hypothetical protein n=1 Tax=Thermomonas sp. TaxID=1971895 RepID=UPI002607E2E1|nr:hypothetical protein [Thermomonas sp.]MBL0227685.1 hypothetical protein [Thermomonas sp.]
MKRALVSVLVLASLAPIAAMARTAPAFPLFAGRDMSVNGDVHTGAVAPIADLGPLNPALAGVSADAHRVAVLR